MTNPKDHATKSNSTSSGSVSKDLKATSSKPASMPLSSVKNSTAPTQGKAASDAWQKRVGAAHKVWSKLSESELKNSEGQAAKLAELVQQRYSISRSDADKQVKNFMDNRQS
jgi:uncharacterized protein YjbJ (UPF0337 family)